MTPALISFPCRCSADMLLRLDAFATSINSGVSRSQAAQYLVEKFLAQPVFSSTLSAKELRVPMVKHITIALRSETVQRIGEYALMHQITPSAVFRLVLFEELYHHAN